MVDMKTETKPQTHQHEEKRVNPRDAIRESRQRRLKLIAGNKPKTIKVYAANEDMRAVLRHGTGVRFRDKLDQAVEWPNDSFTARRIADGSVRTDGPGSGDQEAPDESLNPRQQSAARSGQQKVEQHKEEHSRNGGSKPKPQPEPHPSHPSA